MNGMTLRTISRQELKTKMEDHHDFILVETLSEDSFSKGHLPGAINIPPDQLRELAPDRLPDKNAEIVVYCAKPT